MRTEEHKRIEDLLERFFEGQTSNEEERVLYDFFAGPDVPSHLRRYKEVFGYFESGICLDFIEQPERSLPVKKSSDKRRFGWAIATCAAASLLLLLLNTFFTNRRDSFNPYEGSYIVRSGVVITDTKKIEAELEATYRASVVMERNADRLLKRADCLDDLSDRLNRELEKEYGDLLRKIPDDKVRREVYKMLESGK